MQLAVGTRERAPEDDARMRQRSGMCADEGWVWRGCSAVGRGAGNCKHEATGEQTSAIRVEARAAMPMWNCVRSD
jgi:hypothetical protein